MGLAGASRGGRARAGAGCLAEDGGDDLVGDRIELSNGGTDGG